MTKLLTFALAGILAGVPAASSVEAAQLGAVFEAARERAERERAEKERAEREKAERERIERERADRERAERDRVERERVERERTTRDSRGDRVCMYEHAGYQGWEQCFSPGDELASLRTRNDKVSSIRVVGRANISVFDASDFRGQELRITDDVPDLVLRSRRSGNWNDAIESFRVNMDRNNNNNDITRRREPRDGICVYDRTGFQGRSQCWTMGDSLPDLTRTGADWSDRISSIRLFGRASAELYSEVRFRGDTLIVDRNISDLSQYRVSGAGNGRGNQGRGNGNGNGRGNRSWNDQVESLRVISQRSADNRR